MSNLLTPVDSRILEAVTGGTTTTPTTPRTSSSDTLLQTLTSLSNTIKDIGTAAKSSGFSTTEVLMLGLILNQQRNSVVFVRHPFW